VADWLNLDQAKDRSMALGFSAEDAKTQITAIVQDAMSGYGAGIRVDGKPPGESWPLILQRCPWVIWEGKPGCGLIEIHREDFERLLGAATGRSMILRDDTPKGDVSESVGSAVESPVIYGGTGLPGKPSKSWHLIEAECRRRYDAGERHPNRTGIESRREWARVLRGWLKSEHKNAPAPEEKTLTNKLADLLSELAQPGA
jgi:hypothetical protein